jgi:hypothetical protein
MLVKARFGNFIGSRFLTSKVLKKDRIPSYMVLDITHFLICSKQLPPFFGYVVDFVVPRFKIPLHGYQVGLGLFTKNGIQ